jgi:hypothetical protein
MKQAADGKPISWFRCPLALLGDEPNLASWVHWAARHSGAFQAGGLSPFEQEARYSAVADEVFTLWSRGVSDSFKESRDGDGG